MEISAFDSFALIVAVAALIASLAALFLSWKQLYEARTSNGGRGMNLRVRNVTREDLTSEDAAVVDEVIAGSAHEYVSFLLSFEVTGPAVYYQVLPYMWGKDGVSEPAGVSMPWPKLTCEDGLIRTVSLIQQELVEGIRFGVAWLEPDGVGLRPGALRFDLDGDLEEWVWRNHMLAKIPFIRPGYWKPRTFPAASIGPLTQPWELRDGRKRKRRVGFNNGG